MTACGSCTTVADCLFGDGCTTTCGGCVASCGGPDYSLLQALCIDCNLCTKETNSAGDCVTIGCLNCTATCPGNADNPEYPTEDTGCGCGACASCAPKAELLSTVTVVSKNGETTVVEIYEGTYSISYVSYSGYLFKGYYSMPDGQGGAYTNEQGYFTSDTVPPDGSILYPYYVDRYEGHTFTAIVSLVKDTETVYDVYRFEIPYRGIISDMFTDKMPAINGLDFVGIYTSESRRDDYCISNGSIILDKYEVFNPHTYPSSSSITSESINGEVKYYYNFYIHYQPTMYSIDVIMPDGSIRAFTAIGEKTLSFIGEISYGNLKFVGFFEDSFAYTPCDMDAIIESNMQIYAIFAKEATITFKDHNGDLYTQQTYPIGYQSTLPEPYEREGYEFIGWMFEDENISTNYFSELNVVESYDGVSMKPYWQEARYEISYMVDGDKIKGTGPDFYYYHGEGKNLLTINPADYGFNYYTFGGWYDNEEFIGEPCERIEDSFLGDKTYYAKFIPKKLTVYFDTAGGGTFAEQEVVYGQTFTVNAVPSRNNYTFMGWYLGSTQVTSGTGEGLDVLQVGKLGITGQDMSNGYVILTAKWEKTRYAIYFIANDETFWSSEAYYDEYVTPPQSIPEKVGYSFVCWKYRSEAADFSEIKVTSDMYFYAEFTPNVYRVFLMYNDGTDGFQEVTYKYGQDYLSFNIPSFSNHAFVGWYTEAEGGQIAVNSAGQMFPNFTKNVDGVVLYAHWNED